MTVTCQARSCRPAGSVTALLVYKTVKICVNLPQIIGIWGKGVILTKRVTLHVSTEFWPRWFCPLIIAVSASFWIDRSSD